MLYSFGKKSKVRWWGNNKCPSAVETSTLVIWLEIRISHSLTDVGAWRTLVCRLPASLTMDY